MLGSILATFPWLFKRKHSMKLSLNLSTICEIKGIHYQNYLALLELYLKIDYSLLSKKSYYEIKKNISNPKMLSIFFFFTLIETYKIWIYIQQMNKKNVNYEEDSQIRDLLSNQVLISCWITNFSITLNLNNLNLICIYIILLIQITSLFGGVV